MTVEKDQMEKNHSFVNNGQKGNLVPNCGPKHRKKIDSYRLTSHFFEKAQSVRPTALLNKYIKDVSFWPSAVDPRIEIDLVHKFFGILPANFLPVTLAPVAPFGATSSLSKTSQTNILSTVKGCEVLNNVGVPLALEGLRRIKFDKDRLATCHLATWARLFRTQEMVGNLFTQHFSVLGVCSLRYGKRNECRELAWLTDHLKSFVCLLDKHMTENKIEGYIELWLSDLRVGEKLLKAAGIEKNQIYRTAKNYTQTWLQDSSIDIPNTQDASDRLDPEILKTYGILDEVASLLKIATSLEKKWPHTECKIVTRIEFCRLRGLGHYEGVCYSLIFVDVTGQKHFLGDGGFTPWATTASGGRPSTCLVGSLGTELLLRKFAKVTPKVK